MNESRTHVTHAIRSFRFHSVYVRDFVITMVLILLPLLGLNIFLFRTSERMVTEEASILSAQALRNTRDVVDSIFREVDLLAASISLSSDTALYALSPNLTGILAQDPARAIAARLKIPVYSNVYIHSFYVYSAARDRIITHIGENDRETFIDQTWMPHYQSITEDRIIRRFRRVAGVYPYVISTIKPLYLFDQQQKYGAIVVNVDIDELRRVLVSPDPTSSDPNSPELLYVFDSAGAVLFSTDPTELGLSRRELELDSIAADSDAVISTEQSAHYPWEYMSIHALDTYVLRSAQLRGIVVIVLVLSLVATLVAAVLIAGNAYRPIRRILEIIENPQAVQQLEDSTPVNETRYIAGAIARFTQTNGELRDELHRQLDLIGQARSEALQIQINPHFLYNTLEGISLSARRLTSGPNDVTRMVTLLSKLLRTALDSSEQVVPLSEEIEHTKLYLEILDLRYGGRIRVEWDVPEDLLALGVLKLSLQPLVENAFYHGIKPTRGEGTIRVASRRLEDDLIATVANTGRRISGTALTRIKRSLGGGYELSPEHIGLRNVDQRIRLLFGENYGIDVTDGDSEFSTIVTVRIPVVADPARRAHPSESSG